MSSEDVSHDGIKPNDPEMSSNGQISLKMTVGNEQAARHNLATLNPQLSLHPSEDANDPLNWTGHKKMAVLLTVSATAFLADFGSSLGAVTSVVQSNIQ